MTARGDADEAIVCREMTTGERCQVCGYRAVQRDGLLIHEATISVKSSLVGTLTQAVKQACGDKKP
jgi:hypothetical protein